jgi:hypothetical protein
VEKRAATAAKDLLLFEKGRLKRAFEKGLWLERGAAFQLRRSLVE